MSSYFGSFHLVFYCERHYHVYKHFKSVLFRVLFKLNQFAEKYFTTRTEEYEGILLSVSSNNFKGFYLSRLPFRVIRVQHLISMVFRKIFFSLPVFVVCKQGNDSQKAVSMLKERFSNDDKYRGNGSNIKDIIGGLACWSLRIDKTFPTY